ncbi:MAG: TIGR01777 family oxidoreductase [Stackebrandtia sp.]
MKIVMAGSSGFLGSHLTSHLEGKGHNVVRLVRRDAASDSELAWDPYQTGLDPKALDGVDAVVNLCGAGVPDKRWSPSYKQLIRDSRTKPTHAVASAVAEAGVPLLINASAVGFYGDTGDREVDESAPPADDFLGVTCRLWEEAAAPAVAAGTRVAFLRTGHVMAPDSFMLKRMLPVYKLGLGGKFGSGDQYFPWVSLEDWLGGVEFILDGDLSGPVNLTGPTPATNADFTRALGRAVHRPAPWRVPGFALKLLAGEAAVELLRGAKIRPAALLDAGYVFAHLTVFAALEWAVAGDAG